jgi:hypothetical protein
MQCLWKNRVASKTARSAGRSLGITHTEPKCKCGLTPPIVRHWGPVTAVLATPHELSEQWNLEAELKPPAGWRPLACQGVTRPHRGTLAAMGMAIGGVPSPAYDYQCLCD